MPSMLQNRLSVHLRALRGHEFHAHAISCPEVNSRIEQSFECDGSCNQYRAQGLLCRPSGISQKKIGKLRGTYKKLHSIMSLQFNWLSSSVFAPF